MLKKNRKTVTVCALRTLREISGPVARNRRTKRQETWRVRLVALTPESESYALIRPTSQPPQEKRSSGHPASARADLQ